MKLFKQFTGNLILVGIVALFIDPTTLIGLGVLTLVSIFGWVLTHTCGWPKVWSLFAEFLSCIPWWVFLISWDN